MKTFNSVHKLNNLPEGSVIAFNFDDTSFVSTWRKIEDGWAEYGDLDTYLNPEISEDLAQSRVPFKAVFEPKEKEYLLENSIVILSNVHSADSCIGDTCVIHKKTKHLMRHLPQHWRDDRGIVERICEHSVGHPDPDSPWPKDSYEWIHGCDGCCREINE